MTSQQNAIHSDQQKTLPYQEPYRPQVHFSPPAMWMNDPNGMFYHNGEYHLFYQHNPDDRIWGPMHWGHAVSRDLIHWENLPIALYPDEMGTIFSGSAVVDWNNSSGLGTPDNPAMVALYTYHNVEKEKLGRTDYQTQALAYSLDNGRSWEKYSGNPVIDNPGIKDFRDPKVMWHEASQQWVMVLAQKDHVGFYTSDNLIDWQLQSTFGQDIGSHAGVWECPDLVLLTTPDGESRYVLIVSIMPGGPNGGSATQYFVGDFDGSTFEIDSKMAQQMTPVSGTFPVTTVIEDFEQGLQNWEVEGNAFELVASPSGHAEQMTPPANPGQYLANSFNGDDRATGSLTSKPFTLQAPYINFYIGGGNHPDKAGMQLLLNGQVIKSVTGQNQGTMRYASWDVSDWQGEQVQLRIIDKVTGSWGHTMIDNIVAAHAPAKNRVEPAAWLDYGTDNYAGVTFFTAPGAKENRTLFMGWMSNWHYANDTPTKPWRSAMTVPRELGLVKDASGFRLTQFPIDELSLLSSHDTRTPKLESGERIVSEPDSALRYRLQVDLAEQPQSQLILKNSHGEEVSIRFDATARQIQVDRSISGEIDFYPKFSDLIEADLLGDNLNVAVDVVVDASSVELFINQGQSVITAQIFPQSVLNIFEVGPNSGPVTDLRVEQLDSTWTVTDDHQ